MKRQFFFSFSWDLWLVPTIVGRGLKPACAKASAGEFVLKKAWFYIVILTTFLALFHLGCNPIKDKEIHKDLSGEFKDYWYQGKAEITSYKLEQARYGEIHRGNAVLIFVTEDFSKEQVKMDGYEKRQDEAIKVLKLNAIKKFNTGIYPYSIMQSVFTPVHVAQHKNTLKATTSVQEWCGHTFTQLNLKNDNYEVQLHSYFEDEGEQQFVLDKVLLEDEIRIRIRIAPNDLPTGEIKIIPGTVQARLRHGKLTVETAEAMLTVDAENELMTYTIDYMNNKRTLAIHFKKDFPHEITGWEETYLRGKGDKAAMLTTKAVKNKSLLIDYWKKNRNADRALRDSLGLPAGLQL